MFGYRREFVAAEISSNLKIEVHRSGVHALIVLFRRLGSRGAAVTFTWDW